MNDVVLYIVDAFLALALVASKRDNRELIKRSGALQKKVNKYLEREKRQ